MDGARSPDEVEALSGAAARKRIRHYKPGYNSNRARDGRKEALLLLRKQAAELQTRRDELQRVLALEPSASARHTPDVARQLESGSCRARATQAASVWRHVAATQYKERQRAEMENIHLREVLARQLRMSKSLGKVLKQRRGDRELVSVCGNQQAGTMKTSGPTDLDVDAAVFSELLAGIGRTLEGVDRDLEAIGLARAATPHHDALVRRNGHQVELSVFATKTMPFERPVVGQVAWTHYWRSKDSLPSRAVHHRQRETAGDAIVESFELELESSRKTRARARVRQVLCAFAEPERVVIAWRALSEPCEVAAARVEGVQLVERGYTVVRAATDGQSSHSLVQTCYIIRPEASADAGADQERSALAVTDFLLDSVARTISESHQAIENTLMDQALEQA